MTPEQVAAELQNTARRLGPRFGLEGGNAWEDLPGHVQECYTAVVEDLLDRGVIALLPAPAGVATYIDGDRIAQIVEDGRRAAWHEDDRL